MKKNITINTKNSTIELNSKKFAIASSRYGTDEYKELQNARRDYPNFKVVEISTHKAPKSSYKGLTYKYMEDYIAKHDDEDGTILEEYMTLRAMTDEAEEACAESVNYQEIKTWFLDKYPAIAAFHETRAKLVEAAQVKAKESKQKPTHKTLLQKKMAERRATLVKIGA